MRSFLRRAVHRSAFSRRTGLAAGILACLAAGLLAAGAQARPAVPGEVPPALAPTLDGQMARLEWADAASVFARNGAADLGDYPLAALFYGQDRENFYLALQANGPPRPFTLIWTFPQRPVATRTFTGRLDPASGALRLVDARGQAVAGPRGASGHDLCELAVPWSALAARAGEPFTLQLNLGIVGRFPTPALTLRVPETP